MKWLLHTEIFHGLIIFMIFAACLVAHSFFAKKDPSSKAIIICAAIGYIGSIFVYRLVINPLVQ